MRVLFENRQPDTTFSVVHGNDRECDTECSKERAYDKECGRECDTECDRECTEACYQTGHGIQTHQCTHVPLYLSKAQIQQLIGTGTTSLHHTPELYRQPYGDGHVIVCDPIGTGRIAVVDAEAADLLERFRTPTTLADVCRDGEEHERTVATIALFYTLGFLQHSTQPPISLPRKSVRTLSAWLHITNACNLRCTYCYLDKTSESMSDDISKQAIDAIFRSAVKNQFKRVRLRYAGGEASLHSQRVIALHDYALTLARQYNIELHASILSNGVFLAQRTIEQFKKRHIGVMISLDGIGSFHDEQRPFVNGRGSFQFVERTITRLLANKLVPHISVTVSQRNLSGLVELISYILTKNLPFSLNYYRDNDCSSHIHDLRFSEAQMIETMRSVFTVIKGNLPTRSLLNSLIDKANLEYTHDRACGVGQSYLVIDQNGNVAKCHADIKQTVATIAADDPLLIVRHNTQGVRGHSVHEKEGCRSCSWRSWCGGGCPLLTYRATGRNDVKSPNCSIYKALFPDVLHLEAARLLKYGFPYPLPSEHLLSTSLARS